MQSQDQEAVTSGARLAEAREEYMYWEKLAIACPGDRMAQLARRQAYTRWLVAVRYWRLNNGS